MRRGAAVVAAAGAGMLALLAWAAVAPHSLLGVAVRQTFGVLCHQDPARSFAWAGEALCVCHRCAGIYVGLLAGALAVLAGLRVAPTSRLAWALAAAPMALHVAVTWLTPAVDLWWLRVATGAAFGLFVGAALACALGSLFVTQRKGSGETLGNTAGLAPQKEGT